MLDCSDKEANSTPLLKITTGVQYPSEWIEVISFYDDNIKKKRIEVGWSLHWSDRGS